MTIQEFQQTVKHYYRAQARDFPWRPPHLLFDTSGRLDPYSIMVSEFMLQQTQVSRVVPKFEQFLDLFPTYSVLADAPLEAVLRAWSGLGYNRRAKFLWLSARLLNEQEIIITADTTAIELSQLPGVGINTAAAILTYSFNTPQVFIETNIRTAFLHLFFEEEANVGDGRLMPLIEQAVDNENPRDWYYALMDYGSYLKKVFVNPSRRSIHHKPQSTFDGSRRQLRGSIIKKLLSGPISKSKLSATHDDARFESVVADLLSEGLIREDDTSLFLGR